MDRDWKAEEVIVGSIWFIGGEHREIVERYDIDSAYVASANAPARIPMVKMCPLESSGKRKKVKTMFPVEAWRVAYYGEPSMAFA